MVSGVDDWGVTGWVVFVFCFIFLCCHVLAVVGVPTDVIETYTLAMNLFLEVHD